MNRLFDDYEQTTPVRRSLTALQWAEALLITSGLICFSWFGYNWLASQADQIWSNYKLDAALTGEEPTLGGFVSHIVGQHNPQEKRKTGSANPHAEPEQPAARLRAHVPNGENIGRIEIPRLGIAAIVRQGVDDPVLSRAVGHVPSTALPGEAGNIGLAAHRDSYFRNLRDVKEGDKIRMVTPEGTFEYAVESLDIVKPTNVEVLDPTPLPSLTLVTCYPFNFVGHAPKRFIVRARQIGAEDAPAQTALESPPPKAARVSASATRARHRTLRKQTFLRSSLRRP